MPSNETLLSVLTIRPSPHRARYHLSVLTARRYASAICAAVLCPSACPSVTSRYCANITKCMVTQRTPHNSSGTL